MNKKNKKAFLGAIIGLAGGLLGSAITAGGQKRQQREAQRQENVKAAYAHANALEDSLNSNAIDEYFKDKISLKNGGVVKYDRIKHNKLYRCGGRRRKDFGGNFLNSNVATSTIGALGQIGSALIGNTAFNSNTNTNNTGFNFLPKTQITPNSYNIADYRNNLYNTKLLRFGGKCKSKCK